jgi:dienelactone hydrolase
VSSYVNPVYEGTFERGPLPPDFEEPGRYQLRELGRTIEYLETRDDIDAERLAYLGTSWGAEMGAYLCSDFRRHPVGDRKRYPFKALVLAAGGLEGNPLPESSPVSFAPKVRTPVLVINGRYDVVFDLETQIKPFFELFGAPPEHKRLALAEAGHVVPWIWVLRESNDWLDRYLGPVARTPLAGGSSRGDS